MKISIIKEDNKVVLDGVPFEVDCSGLPDGFHALQWYHTWGDKESKDERFNHQNEPVDDLAPYQYLIDQALAKKAVTDAAAAQAKAAAEAAAKSPPPSGEIKFID